MKTTQLFLLYFLFSIYTDSFRSAAAAPEAVRDSRGKKLLPDAYYFIVPADIRHNDRGGGLTVSGRGNDTCPLAVVQESRKSRKGLPVRFYPPQETKNGIVPLATDLNFKFSNREKCEESTIWRLDLLDDRTGMYFMGVGGVVGDTSPNGLTSWFKIERYGKGYKLVYCPTFCSDCRDVCKSLGIVYQDGKRYLAQTDVHPLKIIFKRAK